MRPPAAVLWIIVSVIPAGAQSLICFGNEPNWSISFNAPNRARVAVSGAAPREFRGRETRNDFLLERVWRGSATPRGRELVLFIREAACSDGMSDKMHPMFARASMPNGSFLTGCCRIPGGPAATTTLEGLPWRLVNLPGQPPSTLAALGRAVSVQFDSGRVTGFTGCNTVTGSYTVNGNRLTLGKLAGTMMACPGTASTVEDAFNKAFTGTLSYAVAGDRLNLTTASGSVLELEREAAPTLTGRTWSVTGYNNGREAVVSPITGNQLTLSFENGTVSGQAGCNTFRASYTEEGNRIKIGPIATTRMNCADDVMAQERDFLKALESAVRWNIQGDELDMHRADDQRALTATSAQVK